MKINKLLFLLSTLIFVLIPFLAYSEILKKVEIKGNQRISDGTILVFGDIKKGESYDANGINNIIKLLYETTFFSNIETSFENGFLKINVTENPIVNLLIFKGEKADKFKKKLTEILRMKEKTSFSKSKVKQDLNTIKLFYRELGYYFVDVEVETQELSNNTLNVVYSINKGERAEIEKIYFIGDKKIRDKKLREIITSEESKFWKFISKGKYLNYQRVNLDKRLLTNYYKNKGYYDVKVKSNTVEYAEGKGFVLTFNIDAGNRYRIKKAFINVAENLDKSPFIVLNKDLNKIVGSYYSPRKIEKVLSRIDKLSEQKELQFINHKIKETLDEDMIEVKIDVYEGEKFFIERINIVGNNVTNDSVIRSALITDEGDPYSPLLINKSINKIKAKNLFAKVNQKILPGSSNDLKVIEIEVEEKSTGEMIAGAGIGTSGGSIGFEIKENNFLGTGVRLDASIEVTEETLRGRFTVDNPNFNYSGNSLTTTIQSTKIDRATASGYESTKTGFSVGTRFEQYEDLFLAPSFSFHYEDVSTTPNASDKIKKMEGSYLSTNLGYSIISDKRNQWFQTTDGYRASFYQRVPLFADSPTLINGLEYTGYQPITEDIIGSLKFFGRAATGIGDEDVKISERLNLPRKYLRGFKQNRIGPTDKEDHVGGNYAAALGINANFPNLLPEDLRTDINFFLDTGSVWGVDYDDTLPISDTLRSAFGVSANIFTPIGPLNITLSNALTKDSLDHTESFRFQLGTTF